MDYQKREEIFSKEAIDIKDVMQLYGIAYSTASQLVLKWKAKLENPRLWIDGKIHVLDYLDLMRVEEKDRIERYFQKNPVDERTESILASAKRSHSV